MKLFYSNIKRDFNIRDTIEDDELVYIGDNFKIKCRQAINYKYGFIVEFRNNHDEYYLIIKYFDITNISYLDVYIFINNALKNLS